MLGGRASSPSSRALAPTPQQSPSDIGIPVWDNSVSGNANSQQRGVRGLCRTWGRASTGNAHFYRQRIICSYKGPWIAESAALVGALQARKRGFGRSPQRPRRSPPVRRITSDIGTMRMFYCYSSAWVGLLFAPHRVRRSTDSRTAICDQETDLLIPSSRDFMPRGRDKMPHP